MKKRAASEGIQAEKGKETDSPPEPPERKAAPLTPRFQPLRLVSDFLFTELYHNKIVLFSGISSWQLFAAAKETNTAT